MTMPETTARASRRAPILVVVIVLVAAGVAAGRAHAVRAPRAAAPVDAAQLPRGRALSTAWYCPGLPASFPVRQQTLSLSNLGPGDADAVVTVQPDNGAAPVVRTVTVPHDSVRTFDRASLSKAPGPLVVEPFSSDVVVQSGLESDDALDQVTCADSAGTHWYFAAGTTARGVSQWLVLDDPFATDARVDVAIRTESGLTLLPDLQGLDVPGRTRVVVPIHDQAVRRKRVSVEVHAVLGRVVASQTLQFAAASGTPGVAATLGALAPSGRWWFADGYTFPDASQWVALSVLGPLDAHVTVQALVGSGGIVPPVALTVPGEGTSWVQVGGCERLEAGCLHVPAKTGYQIQLQSDRRVPILAQTLSRFGDQQTALGATTSTGSTVAATRWVIPRTHARAERTPTPGTNPGTSIWLMNAGGRPAEVSVEVVRGGTVERPAALQHVTIAPSSRLGLPARTLGAAGGEDAAVVITSDQPIFAESTIYARRDASRAPGIPDR